MLALVFTACDNINPESSEELLGTWQLTEVLADPGDGSGRYQPVTSDRTLEFFANGTYRSNENICPTGISTATTSQGTVNLTDSTLTVEGCRFNDADMKLGFEVDEGTLYLLLPCIEPCGQKYVKAK